MKALDVSVEPSSWTGSNVASWRVHVLLEDDIPDVHEWVYQEVSLGRSRTLYYATDYEYVSYFVSVPNDETGYGGRIFRPLVLDPVSSQRFIRREVKGPWSSSSLIVNCLIDNRTLVGKCCREVTFHTGGTWEKSLVSGNATISWLRKALQEHLYGWRLNRSKRPNWETYYEVYPRALERRYVK